MRLAATVMLLRPSANGPFEIFMLRRSTASAFAPDVYVFPGGTLDGQDLGEEALARTRGLSAERVAREFRAELAPGLAEPGVVAPSPHEAAGLFFTALRELFEEAGVLLVRGGNGEPVAPHAFAAHSQRLHAARKQVANGSLPFAELLREFDFFADAGSLTLFSQWITPPGEARRYNAHFFVAKVLPDQAAVADAFETHDGIWIAPRDALSRLKEGTLRMVYPTIKHVERLARFEDADELVAFARTKPILSIMPDSTGDRGFAMPAHLEFAW
ncbi:MAG: NUDIX hydrolase [Vulcanimicrobiaceae bacterium]